MIQNCIKLNLLLLCTCTFTLTGANLKLTTKYLKTGISTSGQILSSKNPQWSQFFSGTPFEKRSKAIGVYGISNDFKEKEKVGMHS